MSSSREPGQTPTPIIEVTSKPSWRPALRRIRKGLFPSKEVSHERRAEPVGMPSHANDNDSHVELWWHGQTLRPQTERPKPSVISNTVSTPGDHPYGTGEPHGVTGIFSIKRTLSKSKTQQAASDGIVGNDDEPRQLSRKLQSKRRPVNNESTISPQSARKQRPIPDRQQDSEPLRPSTASYIPQHAARDFTLNTSPKKSTKSQNTIFNTSPKKPTKSQNPRPSTSYVPTHAASDFSRINVTPKISPNDPLILQYTQDSIQLDEPSTIRLISPDPFSESTDFQIFLEQSKIASARTTASRWDKSKPHSRPIEMPNVMDEVRANYYAGMRKKEKAVSISQRSKLSARTTGGRSLVEKVGDYIRPARPESAYSQNMGHGSVFGDDPDKNSVKGSVAEGQERWDKRWSRVSGTLRRSLSRDRNVENSVNVEDRKRRSRVMPVSPGLKKYNKSVAVY